VKKLLNKVCLVTGGTRGIGKAIVYALVEQGAAVAVNYINSDELAQQICQDIERGGGRAIPLRADVAKLNEVQKMVDTVLKEFGKIDVLVNNAGAITVNKLINTTLEDWNRLIATNLTGVFLCTKAVIPSMLRHKEGRIINISSNLGQVGASEWVTYSATKGGVIAFTKALARELIEDGIFVNCIAPGPIQTTISANVSKKFLETKINSMPLRRFGLPEEVASTVVFLASSDSSIYVGQTLCPNCGDTMLG